ncbi:MAG: hypothetical protein AAGU27_19740 [Dehalobacterium sp.]
MSNIIIVLIGIFIVLGILSFIVKKTFKIIIYVSLIAFAIFYFSTGGDFTKAFNRTLEFNKSGGQYVVNTASDYIQKNVKVTVENSDEGAVAKIEYLNYTIKNVIGTKEYELYKDNQLLKTIELDEVITIDKDSKTINLPENLIKQIDQQ